MDMETMEQENFYFFYLRQNFFNTWKQDQTNRNLHTYTVCKAAWSKNREIHPS